MMASTKRFRLKWFGKQVTAAMRAKAASRLNYVAEHLRGKIVRNLSTPTRTHGPSKVGEFPHADTGKLRQSIFVGRADPGDKNPSALVGTNLIYGRVHEIKRSFLRRTLYEEFPVMRQIVLRGGRGGGGGNFTITGVDE
jgi:hypothetical protein